MSARRRAAVAAGKNVTPVVVGVKGVKVVIAGLLSGVN
jgi:hypothetical protein